MKNKVIQFRLTEVESKLIRQKAKDSHQSVSAYLRNTAIRNPKQ